MKNLNLIELVEKEFDPEAYKKLHWEGSFEEYLSLVEKTPRIVCSAFQRVYDMIISYGVKEYTVHKKRMRHYKFFDDPMRKDDNINDAIFGLDQPLMRLVSIFKAAANHYGPEKRVLLLHGPVGSSKSTIARIIKKGLEQYTKTPDGALYSYRWKKGSSYEDCPMHEEPLHLIPAESRSKVINEINSKLKDDEKIQLEGDLCPFCRQTYRELMKKHDGNWSQVIEEVQVYRLLLKEKDRIGIGTFQPKDEKNQDSTELTGDINYRKIAEYGSDSDPRAFNFDGEFNIANRGVIEFIEVLKLDVAFLYDLLGASQEHKIKPKKFAQTDIDEVIIAHTNEPEYRKLQGNEYMEALRDRTIKVDIPYVTKLEDEIKIYERDFNPKKTRGKHFCYNRIEIHCSRWN